MQSSHFDHNGHWPDSPWNGGGWLWQPGVNGVNHPAHDGNRAATGHLGQILSDTFVEGSTYTLTAFAMPRDGGTGTFYADSSAIYLFAGDNPPVTNTDLGFADDDPFDGGGTDGPDDWFVFSNMLDGSFGNMTSGQWTQVSLTYVATAADHGKPIGIALAGQVGAPQAYFDFVQLTVQAAPVAAVPESASIALWSILGVVAVAVGARRWRKR
jgi:hypothetical protein